MTTFLFLKKQIILCHHCNHSFSLKTDLVNFGCFISNITKLSIVTDLTKKRSEKVISSYMITSIKTLENFSKYIKNTFNNKYLSGYTEVLKILLKSLRELLLDLEILLDLKLEL